MIVDVFAEGATEEKVLQQLRKRVIPGLSYLPIDGKGKDQVNIQVARRLGQKIEEHVAVRALVMRDLDAHEGETEAGIVQSVRETLRRVINVRISGATPFIEFVQHPEHPSVYTLELSRPDLRLALHIATYRWRDEFIKATMDDYVLSLAVKPTTALTLIAQKKWPTTPAEVLSKVTIEIPGLLSNNGILLQEAKDFIRLYIAVIQDPTSPSVFAGKTLANANETDIRQVFASLLAAIEFVGG